MTTIAEDIPTWKDVTEAANILEGVANRTPVNTSRFLNAELGVNCFFKCENFQRMGAFKFRGGYNALYHLQQASESSSSKKKEDGGQQQKKSVVTYSSGNHAQAVALSAKLLKMEATIIMPHDAPKNKVEATKGYGGNVIIYDRYKEDRIAIAKERAQNGATIIPS